MGRFNLGKPNPFWKHMPKWATKDSQRMIINLHQIERRLRQEIRETQIHHWTREEILQRYPDGRA